MFRCILKTTCFKRQESVTPVALYLGRFLPLKVWPFLQEEVCIFIVVLPIELLTLGSEIVLHASSRMKKAEATRTQNNYVYNL